MLTETLNTSFNYTEFFKNEPLTSYSEDLKKINNNCMYIKDISTFEPF